VLSRGELAVVAALAVEHDLTVITDEVYEHLTYGVEHVPIATLPGMAERTLTISSIGKSYSFTGWKVGWATGPAALVGALLSAKQWLTFTSGAPLQPAAAHALTSAADYPKQLAASLQERRDLLLAGLAEAGLPTRTPDGTYFAVTDIGHLGWADAHEFCLALPERAGVVGIPVQAFYNAHPDAGRQLVRWTFCKRPEVLAEAVSRLGAARLTR
jgi:N-succinyldiaminopimelate aminotransferase